MDWNRGAGPVLYHYDESPEVVIERTGIGTDLQSEVFPESYRLSVLANDGGNDLEVAFGSLDDDPDLFRLPAGDFLEDELLVPLGGGISVMHFRAGSGTTDFRVKLIRSPDWWAFAPEVREAMDRLARQVGAQCRRGRN